MFRLVVIFQETARNHFRGVGGRKVHAKLYARNYSVAFAGQYMPCVLSRKWLSCKLLRSKATVFFICKIISITLASKWTYLAPKGQFLMSAKLFIGTPLMGNKVVQKNKPVFTKEKWYDLIDALNSTSRYLDELLNIDNIHFEHLFHRIYPAELQLNKTNASDTEAAFLDLNLSIHNDIVSTKRYDERDDFNFDIVNFPFLDGDVPRRPSYGVYIFQIICFVRASSHVTDFNTRNKFLTDNFLSKAIGIINSTKHFLNFIVGTLN